jgi:hypothetical protein
MRHLIEFGIYIVFGACLFMATFWRELQANTANQYVLKLSITMIAWPLVPVIAVGWWTQEKIAQRQE